jgi:hypothetical protein
LNLCRSHSLQMTIRRKCFENIFWNLVYVPQIMCIIIILIIIIIIIIIIPQIKNKC